MASERVAEVSSKVAGSAVALASSPARTGLFFWDMMLGGMGAQLNRALTTRETTAPSQALRHAPQNALFRRLLHDDSADPRAQLAGNLLLRLYPIVLDDDAAVAFLDRFLSTDNGTGNLLHADFRFPPLVPAGREADLLDRFAAHGGR